MEAAAQASPYYDFSWVLSGDRLAAPLQVFDDGRRMWLQFSVSQGRPQLFGGTEQGWVALDYRVQGAYVVLDAVWPQVQVRVGALEALVERQTEAQRLEVQIGQRRDGWVEILSGLEPGAQVVVSGLQKVREGTRVNASSADIAPPPAFDPSTSAS